MGNTMQLQICAICMCYEVQLPPKLMDCSFVRKLLSLNTPEWSEKHLFVATVDCNQLHAEELVNINLKKPLT